METFSRCNRILIACFRLHVLGMLRYMFRKFSFTYDYKAWLFQVKYGSDRYSQNLKINGKLMKFSKFRLIPILPEKLSINLLLCHLCDGNLWKYLQKMAKLVEEEKLVTLQFKMQVTEGSRDFQWLWAFLKTSSLHFSKELHEAHIKACTGLLDCVYGFCLASNWHTLGGAGNFIYIP